MSILKLREAPRAAWLGASALFFVFHAVYLKTALPSIGWGDGPDFILCSWFLGVPHSTGYPILLQLGRLFLSIPVDEPAFRMNLISAAAGALAVCGFFLFLARAFRARVPALLAAAAFGLSSFLWERTTEIEAYALNALFAAAALAMALEGSRRLQASLIFAFIAAMGMGNHGTFIAPLVFLFVWVAAGSVRNGFWKNAFPAAAFLAISCSILYAGLPLLAARRPPFNWLQPRDPASLLALMTGKEFWVIGEYNAALSWKTVVELTREIDRQFTPLFWPLVGLGALAFRTWPLLPTALSGAAFFTALFPILYPTYEKDAFFLLAFLLLSALAGGAVCRAAVWLAGRPRAFRGAEALAAAVVLLPLCAGLFARNSGRLKAPNHAAEYSRKLLEAAPPNALFFIDHVGNDALAGPLYYQFIKGERTDAFLFHRLYLAFPWYADYMKARAEWAGHRLAMPGSVNVMTAGLSPGELARGVAFRRLNMSEIDVWTRDIYDLNFLRRPILMNSPQRFLGSVKSEGLRFFPILGEGDRQIFRLAPKESRSADRINCESIGEESSVGEISDPILREIAFQSRVDLGHAARRECGDVKSAIQALESAQNLRFDCDVSRTLAQFHLEAGDARKAKRSMNAYSACLRRAALGR